MTSKLKQWSGPALAAGEILAPVRTGTTVRAPLLSRVPYSQRGSETQIVRWEKTCDDRGHCMI
jgi:hypothetical protein